MSFTGDLEHLPIVDVIQLLNATRKSGTLTVKSNKGESGLVFKDGFIVSANHLNDSVRVGKILVEQKVITDEVLVRALLEQKHAGENRKPLIAMLIEKDQIKKGEGFASLETLIEMTIVEILTWGRGTFSFDMGNVVVSDEYRYFPENLQQEVHLDAQSALMDALRIYDEKKRDGRLEEGGIWSEGPALEELLGPAAEEGTEGEAVISAEDLGLDDLDHLERKIPKVFSGIEDRQSEKVGPDEIQRSKVREAAPWLAPEEQEKLVAFFTETATAPREEKSEATSEEPPRVVVLFSSDPLLTHALPLVCNPEGISVFVTDEDQDLGLILEQYLAKTTVPLLVLDRPENTPEEEAAETIGALRRRKREKYPQIFTIQLASPGDYRFSLQAFVDGVRAVFPRPLTGETREGFAADTLEFLKTFPAYLKACFHQTRGQGQDAGLQAYLLALRQIKDPPKVAFALLQIVSEMVERAVTLVVKPTELIVEREIGIHAGAAEGPSSPLGIRISLAKPSIFREVVEQGELFFGESADEVLRESLYKEIGAPQGSTILLLPMKVRGKTVSLTYGDFGPKEARSVPEDLLKIIADQAGLALENALFQKKLEKLGATQ